MKFKSFVFALLGAFALVSCDAKWPWEEDIARSPSDINTDDDGDITGKNGNFYGGLVEGTKYSGYEFSKSNKEISKPTAGTGSVTIFGINDFHGAIKSDTNHMGLAKLGSIVKEETSKENTLFFDQGDTWQGSYESNQDYGAIIQDVFTYAGMNLRTVGNHDFDWGIEKLQSTSSRKHSGRYIPSLASNVFNYDWDTKTTGTSQQKNIGKDYVTYVLDNGLKVGVVGVIGNDQITSICTPIVKNISFTDHNEKIEEISDFLRVTKKCDIVVASVHAYASQCNEDELSSISPVSGKKYVDLVLNGHAHSKADWTTNGVHFVQWDSNGQTVGKVELKYNFETNQVSSSTTKTYYADSVSRTYPTNDPTIEEMVSTYLQTASQVGEQVLSTKFSGGFDSDAELPNLMTKAIYEEAVAEGYDVDYAVCNYARSGFYSSTMTYSDLYTCFPFDNEVIIMDIYGPTCATSIKYNSSYHASSNLDVIGNYQTYTIACLDYIAFHCSTSREYDYFPGATGKGKLVKDGKIYTYREILKDYLLAHPNEEFESNSYVSTLVSNFHVS